MLFSSCASNPESIATKERMTEYKKGNSYGIFGHVARQGKYTLDDVSSRLTVSQALLRAGGFGPYADKEHVVLRRGAGSLEQRNLVNLDAIMRRKDPHEMDPIVWAGDVIIVYEMAAFNKL